MQNVLIVGAGGHAQVVASILHQTMALGADIDIVGYVDEDSTLKGQVILGRPVLGQVADIDTIRHDAMIIGVGDNHARCRLFELARRRGEMLVSAIHPSVSIAPDVRLGTGLALSAGVVIVTGSVVGNNVVLSPNTSVGHHGRIGSHVLTGPGVMLGGGVTIGDGTLVGIGSAVVPGRSIGEWSVVGAGSTVTQDIPAYCTAMGSPARLIKYHGAG